jgi:hypothetical protein
LEPNISVVSGTIVRSFLKDGVGIGGAIAGASFGLGILAGVSPGTIVILLAMVGSGASIVLETAIETPPDERLENGRDVDVENGRDAEGATAGYDRFDADDVPNPVQRAEFVTLGVTAYGFAGLAILLLVV